MGISVLTTTKAKNILSQFSLDINLEFYYWSKKIQAVLEKTAAQRLWQIN